MLSKSRSKDPVFHVIAGDERSRAHHTSTLFDHYIILIGGALSGSQKEISLFNIQTWRWQEAQLEGVELKRRICHTACAYDGNRIIVYGGLKQGRVSNTITLLDIAKEDEDITLHCENIEMKVDDPRRYLHCAEIYQEKMFVFGGKDEYNHSSNVLWSLALKTFEWKKCLQKGAIPKRDFEHRSALLDNKMFVFSGCKTNICENVLSCLNLDTLHWTEMKCSGTIPRPRYGMSFTQYKGFLYVYGGYPPHQEDEKEDQEDFFTSYMYGFNLKKNEWKVIDYKAWLTKPGFDIYHTMTPYENGIFFFGEESNHQEHQFCPFYYLSLGSTSYREEKRKKNYIQMSQLCLKSQYSDVTFLVEGKSIFAHKIVLAAQCQFFSNMFTSETSGFMTLIPHYFIGGMLESNQKEIQIPDCKAEVLEAFLKYIYLGELDLTERLAQDLLVLSNKWLEKELGQECEDFLIEKLKLDNIVKVSELAEELGTDKLAKAAREFVIKNAGELRETGDLLKVPLGTFLDIIFELIDKVDAQIAQKKVTM